MIVTEAGKPRRQRAIGERRIDIGSTVTVDGVEIALRDQLRRLPSRVGRRGNWRVVIGPERMHGDGLRAKDRGRAGDIDRNIVAADTWRV